LSKAPQHLGEFRVPPLRHAGLTAPYMHNGSIETLRDVVAHYSKMNTDRLQGDAAKRLKPLHLNARETDDLLVFLESLTNYRTPTWRETPHMTPCD
jgi:cytochrome c peroxidase